MNVSCEHNVTKIGYDRSAEKTLLKNCNSCDLENPGTTPLRIFFLKDFSWSTTGTLKLEIIAKGLRSLASQNLEYEDLFQTIGNIVIQGEFDTGYIMQNVMKLLSNWFCLSPLPSHGLAAPSSQVSISIK